MLRFLHTADLHLDSPLKGLQRYEGAPVQEIRSATRRALENLVQLAIDRDVHVVVIAGDVFDGDWKDTHTGLFFSRQLTRLVEHGIRVVMIRGNHDAANRMTQTLRLPQGVHLMGVDAPETVDWSDLGIVIHGQSFAEVAEKRNLALDYPAAISGVFNLGLLHTSLTGAEGHDHYAPCTPDDLRRKEYQYWALGHIHQRDDASYRDPAIVFPGNPQGRHIRETGPKGCVIGEVENATLTSLEFVEVDVFRWERITVDLADCVDTEEMLQLVDEELMAVLSRHASKPLAVRIELAGNTSLHRMLGAQADRWRQEVRNCGIQVGHDRLWIEKVQVRTSEKDTHHFDSLDDGPLTELRSELDRMRVDQEVWNQVAELLAGLQRKLPDGSRQSLEQLRRSTDQERNDFLDRVQALLAGRLTGADAT
jgi:DNA repair exonuclease SbcCD nuclease subunit